MDVPMDMIVGLLAGLALSAAAGFRVFVPLLLTGLAARLGYLQLTGDMTWLGSDPALVALASATVIEIGAYYVPWLDNLLDGLATPAAMVAGVMAWAAVTPELSPLLRWTLAVVVGGGAAGVVQSGTTLLRLSSTGLTGGLGNAAVATGELAGSLALGVLGVLAPLVAALLAGTLLIAIGWAGYRRATRRRKAAPYSKP